MKESRVSSHYAHGNGIKSITCPPPGLNLPLHQFSDKSLQLFLAWAYTYFKGIK